LRIEFYFITIFVFLSIKGLYERKQTQIVSFSFVFAVVVVVLNYSVTIIVS